MAKEKLLVNGKRIGQFGFVASRQDLIEALGHTDALAVQIGDAFIGRQGLIGYLRYARGPMVKVTPSGKSILIEHGGAGMAEIPTMKWVPPKQAVNAQMNPVSLEIGNKGNYLPDIGAGELRKALERALTAAGSSYPFNRLVFQGGDGQLRVRATDQYRMVEASLPAIAEGTALIDAKEAQKMLRVLNKASRASLTIREERREVDEIKGGKKKPEKVEVISHYVQLLADYHKFETTPSGDLERHPLRESIPDHVRPKNVVARAYVSARETLEVLRAAGSLAAVDGKRKEGQKLVVAVHNGMVEFTSTSGPSMTLSLEAMTEGEGSVHADAALLLPALKVMGSEPVELTLAPQDNLMGLNGDGVTYVQATVVEKQTKQPDAQKAVA